jgi:hypothetical protein
VVKCPFCAEDIQDSAVKCKHCGEWLDPSKRPPVSSVAEHDKPNYAGRQLYRYQLVGPDGEIRQALCWARDTEEAKRQIADTLPQGFEYAQTLELRLEPTGRFTCPNCASQFTDCHRAIGCAMMIVFFVSLGLGLLLIPLLPFECRCRACQYKWRQ